MEGIGDCLLAASAVAHALDYAERLRCGSRRQHAVTGPFRRLLYSNAPLANGYVNIIALRHDPRL